MAEGRSWSPERFAEEVLGHPVFGPLAARVVWRCGGRSFRPDDGAPRDPAGDKVSLDGEVRVAHPADLSPDELARWGEHFAELRLRSPFAQLSRPTALPEEGDRMPEIATGPIEPERVTLTLEERGWARGEPDDHLRARFLFRRFADGDPVAVILLAPGLAPTRRAARDGPIIDRPRDPSGLGAGLEPQRIESAHFERDVPGGLSAGRDRLPLADVPRRLRSELLYALTLLAG